ncbi:hypothetical protein FKM82_010754 [Ascaphus truei]
MQCNQDLDFYMSFFLGAMGLVFFVRQMTAPATYGRHVSCNNKKASIMVPAKYGWFIQELPSFLVPLLVILYSQHCNSPGCMMLFFMFCGHYFHRTFIYSTFTRGRPSPLPIVIMAVLFCTFNGFLQGHCMVYVAAYPQEWYMDSRFASGVLIFFLGMGINIHSDHILRNLRKPGEVTYKIPKGITSRCLKTIHEGGKL